MRTSPCLPSVQTGPSLRPLTGSSAVSKQTTQQQHNCKDWSSRLQTADWLPSLASVSPLTQTVRPVCPLFFSAVKIRNIVSYVSISLQKF